MASVTCYLTQVLRLKVNLSKSRLCRIERLESLGFSIQGIRIIWSDRAFQLVFRLISSRHRGSNCGSNDATLEDAVGHKLQPECDRAGPTAPKYSSHDCAQSVQRYGAAEQSPDY